MSQTSKPRARSLSSRRETVTRQSNGKPLSKHWLPQLVLDLLLLPAFALSFILLLNLWWHIPVAIRPGGPIGQLFDMLRASGLMAPVGIVALLFTTLIAARRLRLRINTTQQLWNTCCPHCHNTNLQRIRRRPYERRIANMGIPLRRYICLQCNWRGSRIEHTLIPRS
jgi:hypothetical protein